MAQDTKGLKFWLHGSPIAIDGQDTKGVKFWIHGSPISVDIPAASSPSVPLRRRRRIILV